MVVRIGQKSARHRNIYFREWREYRDLTQEQLADRIGCGKSAISKLERGDTLYNASSLEAWSDALGVEPDELLRPPPSQDEPARSDIVKLLELAKPEEKRIVLRLLRTGTDG